MDITSTLHSPPKSSRPHRTSSHTRSFSASGLLSILSPTSLVSSISSPSPASGSGRWRTSSISGGASTSTSSSSSPASSKFGGSISSPNVLGLDVPNSGGGEVDPEEPLPTFEVQPAMLAVDLSLGPGESRSCEFLLICCF